MTRRDTIIVAALVNAGLLIVLFVSALKNEEGKEELVSRQEMTGEVPTLTSHELAYKNEARGVTGDEVDRVLQQYTQVNPLQKPAVETAKAEVVHSFVEDLQLVAKVSEALEELPAPKEEKIVTQSLAPKTQEVIVKKGDVLEKIARHNHTTVADIMKRNGLVSTQLKIGQVLKVVPTENTNSQVAAVEKKPLDPTSAKYYIVKPGDNPWTIAVKNHLKVEELLKLNNMDEEKARKLKPGEKIRIH